MIHTQVDINRWIAQFPLAAVREAHERKCGMPFMLSDIHCPEHLAVMEQARAPFIETHAMGPCVPVDVLLPALGEPPRRAASKVGGLPYRRRGDWPIGRAGRPMSFIAQLCLADSWDVLTRFDRTELPGDVLLIFQDGTEGPWGVHAGYGSPMTFEWQFVGIPDADLMQLADLPPQPVKWTPTYFERYRTVEYPDLPPATSAEANRLGFCPRYMGSKIGGVPVFQQSEDEAKGLGACFACIHSINPCNVDFPFPNVPRSPWGDWPHDQGFLMLGDVGTLYLFVRRKGRVNWLAQCG
jgi:hypothetical protein